MADTGEPVGPNSRETDISVLTSTGIPVVAFDRSRTCFRCAGHPTPSSWRTRRWRSGSLTN